MSSITYFEWSKSTSFQNNDEHQGIVVGEDDSIYLFGHKDEDILLEKFNSDGDKQWTKLLGSQKTNGYPSDEVANASTVSSDGSIYLTGDTDGDFDQKLNQGVTDIFLSKFDMH